MVKDPQTRYLQALQKTNTIQVSEEKMNMTMDFASGSNKSTTKMAMDMKTNRSLKTGAGEMDLSAGSDNISVKMYVNGDTAYLQQGNQNKYIKVNSKNSQFSDKTAQEYADRILNIFKQDPNLQKSVTMTTDSNKNTAITFVLPADKVKGVAEDMMKSSLASDEAKQSIKDQVTAKIKSSLSATDKQKVTDEQIQKIVDEQVNNLDKQMNDIFAKVSFGDLKYVATINSDGYISKQDFTISITSGDSKSADSTKANITLSCTTDQLDASTKIELPSFTAGNTVDGGNLDNLFLGNFAK